MKASRYLLLFLLLYPFLSNSQEQTQQVRGVVIDFVNRSRVEGAHVSMLGTEWTAVTDRNGVFRFERIPVGRYTVLVTHSSFLDSRREFEVISGKETVLDIELNMSVIVLDEIMIRDNEGIIPERAIGGMSINMEQTNRIAANFFDPVRMATSLPGVIAANDQANNLVVRGNSPNSIQWRLEGMSIVNPNHQTNAGTLSDLPVQAGGGVNILSGQMLADSRFVPAPFEADQGNGLSVFDLSYRNGNDESWETTVQASLIGIDIAEEGPVGKGSILANYRYSFVGLLTAAGIDFGGESISFQDLSFNYHLPTKKGEFKLFGLGGLSRNTFEPGEEPNEWEVDKDSRRIKYTGDTGALGAVWMQGIRSNSSIRLSALYSASQQWRRYWELDAFAIPVSGIQSRSYLMDRSILSTRIQFKTRLKNAVMEWGMLNDMHSADLSLISYTGGSQDPLQESGTDLKGWNLQPYWKSKLSFGNGFLLETGLRYSYFTATQSGSFEPRARISYDMSGNSSISLAFSTNSMIQPMDIYLANPSNSELDLTRSRLYTLGFFQGIGSSTRLRAELYYQEVYNSPYSENLGINAVNLFDEEPLFFMSSTGESRNLGADLSLERIMTGNFFYLGGISIYRQQFLHEGNWENGRFDGNYSTHITLGWERSREKPDRYRLFRYNARILYLGGFNLIPLDLAASQQQGQTVLDYQQLYGQPLDDYFRIDVGVSWRVNKSDRSHIWGLDIQNIVNKKNPSFLYYDARMDAEVLKTQLGAIPVMYYKIEF